MKIVGTGRYLPDRIVRSEELEKKYSLESGWCVKTTGIQERRWAEDETISYMCVKAVNEACEDAGIDINEIDYLVNAGNSFDQVMPDECVQVMKESGAFREDIGYVSINCGCLSFLAALDLAASMLSGGTYKYILICSGILASSMVDTSDSLEKYTVGDGAAAVIVKRAEKNENSKLLVARMETYSEHSGVKGFNATKDSKTKILFNKDVLVSGIAFEFDTSEMQSEGLRYNKDFFTRLIPFSRKGINKVIPNQSSRIVSDMLKITFPSKKIKTVIDKYGNIGAAGHAMALYDMIRMDEVNRDDVILLQAMGAGFSIYGLLLIY